MLRETIIRKNNKISKELDFHLKIEFFYNIARRYLQGEIISHAVPQVYMLDVSVFVKIAGGHLFGEFRNLLAIVAGALTPYKGFAFRSQRIVGGVRCCIIYSPQSQ